MTTIVTCTYCGWETVRPGPQWAMEALDKHQRTCATARKARGK